MIKCIFTNIKNEHRYLEEWINYHIRLGFNKFIFYEDEGSISHAELLKKYEGIVDIDIYDYILKKNDFMFKDIRCFKHLFENYTNIDWLIKLDPDEYIVLPSIFTTIDDVLFNIPPQFNELYIPWKLYNACGFIEAPHAGKYSIFNTYIYEITKDKLSDSFNINISKNVYNLGKSFIKYKDFKKEYNTKITDIEIHDTFPYILLKSENVVDLSDIGIFINHYITKSFEEFYIKLKDKGEYDKEYYRQLGDFFVLNPDLIKEIPKIEDKFNVDIFTFKTKLN